MQCPYCHSDNTVVKDSRSFSSTIKRRRECPNCKKRFNTYENYETLPIMVVKKDSNRQLYDRSKIERGVVQALNKRTITPEQLTELIQTIENKIFNQEFLENEIPSEKIGEIVLEELKKLDIVAFIRFASVYKDFNDVESFRRELDRLN